MRTLLCAAIACAYCSVPPFDKCAVMPVARNVWQAIGAAAPAGAEQEALEILANAGGLDIDVRFVQHKDGGLGGEPAALLDITQIGQSSRSAPMRCTATGWIEFIGSSSRNGAGKRIHRSEPGKGLFKCDSLRGPVMTYCASRMLVV